MSQRVPSMDLQADEGEAKEEGDPGLGLRMLKTRTVLVNGPVDQKLAEKVMATLVSSSAATNELPIRGTFQKFVEDVVLRIHHNCHVEKTKTEVNQSWQARHC